MRTRFRRSRVITVQFHASDEPKPGETVHCTVRKPFEATATYMTTPLPAWYVVVRRLPDELELEHLRRE